MRFSTIALLFFVASVSFAQNTHRFYASIGVKPYLNENVQETLMSSLGGVRFIRYKKLEVLAQVMGDYSKSGGLLGTGLRLTHNNFYIPKKLFTYLEANAVWSGNAYFDSRTYLSAGMGWVINESSHFDIGIGSYANKPTAVLRWYRTFGKKLEKESKVFKQNDSKSFRCPPHYREM